MNQPANILPFGGPAGPIGDAGDGPPSEHQKLMEERKLRREAMKLWGGQVITDVTLVIGIRDKDGKPQQVVHEIQADDTIRIIDCAHSMKEEMSPIRVEGKIDGYEPTGKYRLKLDCTYVRL